MHNFRTAAPTRAAAAALLALSCACLAGPAGAVAPTVEFGAAHYDHPLQGFSGDSNWGGYVAQGSNFTSISGSWTMPDVTCDSSKDLYAPWIGIDGYGSQTVEQTGVQVDCSNGSPAYSGWYEMYPAAPQYFNEPVAAGDTFTASVSGSGTSYSLKLSDTTKGWTKTAQASLNADDASAEAVVESPTGSYPSFAEQDFSGITVNGQSFDTYGPQAIDSGQYTETPLNGGSFAIVPG
jgi:hypothetical protein